jgi:DNA-binding NtrC family response regulator
MPPDTPMTAHTGRENLPMQPATPQPPIPPVETEPPLLSTVEREHILRALQHARGNKKAAAKLLGVSRRALYRRLERLGLESTISRRSPSEPDGPQTDESGNFSDDTTPPGIPD